MTVSVCLWLTLYYWISDFAPNGDFFVDFLLIKLAMSLMSLKRKVRAAWPKTTSSFTWIFVQYPSPLPSV
jgi:hypothetical protein